MAYTKQIREFVSKKAKVTNKQIYAQFPELTRKQVSMGMFHLKCDGLVQNVGFGKWKVLTPVNNTESITAKAKPKAKRRAQTVTMTDRATVAERDNRYLREQVADLTHRMTKLNVQYEDALAIVRYLEEKLFIAIQFNAKNNGNT